MVDLKIHTSETKKSKEKGKKKKKENDKGGLSPHW